MEHNKDLYVNRPIVQIGNMAFENKLKRAKRTDLVFVLSVQTLEQIYE